MCQDLDSCQKEAGGMLSVFPETCTISGLSVITFLSPFVTHDLLLISWIHCIMAYFSTTIVLEEPVQVGTRAVNGAEPDFILSSPTSLLSSFPHTHIHLTQLQIL